MLYGKAGGCWTLTDADNAPFGINTPLFGRFEDPRLCSGHASSLLLLFGDVDKDGFRNRIEISLKTAQEGEKSQLVVRRNTVANEFDDEERCWTLVRSFPMKQLVAPCEKEVQEEEDEEEGEESE